MAITALPTPPSRADAANFADRGDAFLGALPAFQSEANALATDVTTKQGIASTAATTATTEAGISTTQAGIATTQAGIATTQAGLATTQAGNALTSANNAEASFDSFDDRYLGAKTSDPTLDNDGDALLTGALYFNSVVGEMRVYSGTAWLESYLPESSFVTLTGVQTLTNKTLTAPVITGASITGNVTGNATTATTLQTARTINGVSFNGSANITITANTPNALTIGTGLSGTSYNGSGPVTVAIDSTVATLTDTQTLTNKTLTAPKIGTGVFDTNGAEVLNIVPVASAVNELSISNAATGGNVLLTTAGGDTNINLLVQTKGAGAITLDTGTGAGQIDLKAGASNVRVWDDNSSHYYQIVTGDRTANYNINLPIGDVTLTAGTSVVTTRNIATTAPLTGGGNLSANRTFALAAGYGDTLNPYASKTANFVLSAPDGTAGVPTFRALVTSDIPTLNQDTTGNAGSVTNGVYTIGNQTIAGVKTFNDSPIVPTPTTNTQAANKLYVDSAATLSFPSGTRMSFNQTSAPTGWTKDTNAALNDSLMRIVNGTVGSGGATNFTTFNNSSSTNAHTLIINEIPSHTHGIRGTADTPSSGFASTAFLVGAGTGTLSSATGGGASHAHTILSNIKYNDFIIASKT